MPLTDTFIVSSGEEGNAPRTAFCKEEMLGADTLLSMLLGIIDRLEKEQDFKTTPTYSLLSSEAYKKMPTIVCMVKGTPLTFLVDSGATNSIIRSSELNPADLKLSGRYTWSLSATGNTVKEKYSTPMICEWQTDEGLMTSKHSFLISDVCPINLLGRDLMCTFNIVITSTPDGLKVSRYADNTSAFVHFSPTTPLYVYQWRLDLTVSVSILQSAADVINPSSDKMASEHLHCTAHVSDGPDTDYAKTFFSDLNDSLLTTDLYWTETECAAAVSLTEKQLRFYDIRFTTTHLHFKTC